jgi:bacterioferritin (cytochrome b1)
MYFHFHCDDQGYDLLANLFKRTAIAEMLHVERLAERILFLKGEVEMKVAAEVKKIHDVSEMLKTAAKMEETAPKNIISGLMNVLQMPIRFQNKYLKVLLWKKKLISINTMLNWKI